MIEPDKVIKCAERRDTHRSRLVLSVNSPNPTPAFGWIFAIRTFVLYGGFWPVGEVPNGRFVDLQFAESEFA